MTAVAPVAPVAPAVRRRGRAADRALWRRWVVATTLGELAAFSVPTAVWGVCSALGASDAATLAPVIAAGAAEGALLATAQAYVLRRALPGLDTGAWVRRTAAAGALGWAIGMAPSTFGGALSGLPTAVLVVFGAAGALTLLGAIGAAQATVLRRHVHGARRWAGANALAWLAGLPVPLVVLAAAPARPGWLRVALAVLAGAGMGAVVAAVTGAALVRLLRRPRRRPPQPLRRRVAIALNHAHGLLLAASGGHLGARIGRHRVLLLSTTGRRTGRARTTPVQYEVIDGRPVLVAAAGGAPQPPAWWRNVEADGNVLVSTGGLGRAAVARTVTSAERARLWPALVRANPGLERVQRRAGRALPVVVLEERPPGEPRTRSDAGYG